jgi:hypothetical protein
MHESYFDWIERNRLFGLFRRFDMLICYNGRAHEEIRIFKVLEQANFKTQPIKCMFATDTVAYLGHIVTKGVKPN